MNNEKQIFPAIRKFKKVMVASAIGLSLATGVSSVPVLNPMITVEAATKKDKKKPKIKYNGKKKFTVVNDGSTYRINKKVTAKDNVDGNVTKKIKVKVKKGNKNVKNIAKITKKGKITLNNTKNLEVGNYSLIVEVSDKAKNKAKKKIATFTVVPEKKDYEKTITVIVPETTEEAPKIIESTEATVATTEMNKDEIKKLFEKTTEAPSTSKNTESKSNSYDIDDKDINYYEKTTEETSTEQSTTEQPTSEDSNNGYDIDEKDVHYYDNEDENNNENKDTKDNENNNENEDTKDNEKDKEEEKEDKLLGEYNNETYYADSENKIYYYQPVEGELVSPIKEYVTYEDYNNISDDWKKAIYIVTNEVSYLGEYNGTIYYVDRDNWIWYFGKQIANTADGTFGQIQILLAVTTYDYHEDSDDWKVSVRKYLGEEVEISETGYQKKYSI